MSSIIHRYDLRLHANAALPHSMCSSPSCGVVGDRPDWLGARACGRAGWVALAALANAPAVCRCASAYGALMMLARSQPSSCQALQGSRIRPRLSTWCAGFIRRRTACAKSVRAEHSYRKPLQPPVGPHPGGYDMPIRHYSQCVDRPDQVTAPVRPKDMDVLKDTDVLFYDSGLMMHRKWQEKSSWLRRPRRTSPPSHRSPWTRSMAGHGPWLPRRRGSVSILLCGNPRCARTGGSCGQHEGKGCGGATIVCGMLPSV